MAPGCIAEHRSGACKTCNSGVCHDCCNCRQHIRGRPHKQLKLQLQIAEHRSGACKTCNSGVCHDCCNCRQHIRGRPHKQLKLQLVNKTRRHSAPAMSMDIVAESVVPWEH